MSQLNYHHLYYFYVVAREGSIVNASKALHLTPQTISGQLTAFEEYLDVKLFDRKGKRLILNESGKLAFGYAEDIFALGGELKNSLSGFTVDQVYTVNVGITDVIPKILSFDLLKTCFELEKKVRLVCREGDYDTLLADLAMGHLDLIISDRPLTPGASVKAYNHLLGETGLTFYAQRSDAKTLAKDFPYSLHRQRFLMCGDKSSQKLNLLSWFDELKITPEIVAEFDDSALMKFFGQSGYGVFCTPSITEQHVTAQYSVAMVGRTKAVNERFYAISPERKLENPATKHLVRAAKALFVSNVTE